MINHEFAALKLTVFISLLIASGFVANGAQGYHEESSMVYFEIESPSLKSMNRVPIGVYLPPGYMANRNHYPVVYFLCGFGQDEKSWESIGIREILDGLIEAKTVPPMIFVTAGSEDTGWVNWINGEYDWEKFIVKDLVGVIDKRYRTLSTSSMRAVSGTSAGGHGALVLAFKYPGVFGSVSSHSAAIHPEDPENLPDWAKNWEGWKDSVGDPINVEFWKSRNPVHLARNLEKNWPGQRSIYFDVGDKDHLGFASTNVVLSKALKDRGISHTFVLRKGGHGSKFVRANARFAIRFHGMYFSREQTEQYR